MSAPATDVVIAACAFHHGARIEHEDADFEAIERAAGRGGNPRQHAELGGPRATRKVGTH